MTGLSALREIHAPRVPLRRGACPTLDDPMPTGDGLLVRLRPVAAGLAPAQWIEIARLSRAFGNGLLDVTARGNLQVRGLDHSSAPLLAQALADAGLAVRSGVAIETPPLSGLDATEIADATPLAERIRAGIAEHRPALKLAPKLAIVVNGGGRINLATMSADLRLDAVRTGAETVWRIAIAGDAFSARPVAEVSEACAAGKVMELLEALDALGQAARGRDLGEDIVAAAPALPARTFALPVEPVGRIPVENIGVMGIRLAFGRMDANALEALMAGLSAFGAQEVRLSPHRALLIIGIRPEETEDALSLAASHGFLIDAKHPANTISSCPGNSGCATARLDTHAVAKTLIAAAPSLLDGSATIHISGCGKGCAHPAVAPLTIVGTASGVGVLLAGRAGDDAPYVVAPADLQSLFTRIEAFCGQRRQPGETTRSILLRTGPAELKALLKGQA